MKRRHQYAVESLNNYNADAAEKAFVSDDIGAVEALNPIQARAVSDGRKRHKQMVADFKEQEKLADELVEEQEVKNTTIPKEESLKKLHLDESLFIKEAKDETNDDGDKVTLTAFAQDSSTKKEAKIKSLKNPQKLIDTIKDMLNDTEAFNKKYADYDTVYIPFPDDKKKFGLVALKNRAGNWKVVDEDIDGLVNATFPLEEQDNLLNRVVMSLVGVYPDNKNKLLINNVIKPRDINAKKYRSIDEVGDTDDTLGYIYGSGDYNTVKGVKVHATSPEKIAWCDYVAKHFDCLFKITSKTNTDCEIKFKQPVVYKD